MLAAESRLCGTKTMSSRPTINEGVAEPDEISSVMENVHTNAFSLSVYAETIAFTVAVPGAGAGSGTGIVTSLSAGSDSPGGSVFFGEHPNTQTAISSGR
jgi:hypothetical protein